MSNYNEIENADVFNECLDELVVDLIKNDLGVDTDEKTGETAELTDWYDDIDNDSDEEILPGVLDHKQIEKSAFIASLLASSEKDSHKRKALAFGILSYLKYRHDEEFESMYERYLYIILSRIGNLPAFQNVKKTESRVQFQHDLLDSLDPVLSTEIAADLDRYSMEGGGVFSGFQRQVYEHLLDGDDVAISGPTSAGKSFILRHYIENKADIESEFEVIYVVPTRALIAEVSKKLNNINEKFENENKEFEVLTGAHLNNEDDSGENVASNKNNRFLVVTPERCLNLIDPEMSGRISPDLIFFDEFQSLEDKQRGVLFEAIIRTIKNNYPDAQVVAAGPYLEKPEETLEELTGNDVSKVVTKFTPVLQVKSSLKFISQNSKNNRQLELTIHSPSDNKHSITIDEPESITYSDVKSSFTQTLPAIINKFGAESQNLIYSGQKNYAEDRASALAESKQPRTQTDQTKDLIEFLKETIHEDYSLIEALRNGVAFHHGMVPKLAREEIENIYTNTGDIRTIVTTPTLMQGVNLPAEKIFLVGANRGQGKLSDFEFNNLIGRVGRIDQKLYGAIYCIETEGDEWANEKLEKSGEKEIEPATDQAVSESDKLISALQQRDLGSVEDPSIKYTSVLLRGRYIKDDDAETFLENKGMSAEDIDRASSALEETISDVSIPTNLLRQNPTIDPIKQNTLYESVKKNPDKWILANSHRQYSYDSFLQITKKLNQRFKFVRDEPIVEPAIEEVDYGAIEPIVVTANHWLRGHTYNDMIQSRQDHEDINDDSIDQSIRKVMNLVDNDIRFVLVKYYGLLTTILEEIDHDTPRWMLEFDQMLERGSIEFNRLELMSKGVDRSVAVSLYIPDNVDNPIEYVKDNKYSIPDFQRRHLENQGIF
jgi:replicative superfamily II helicase